MQRPLSISILLIFTSCLINIKALGFQDQSLESKVIGGDVSGSSQVPGLGCFACRHSCCYFTTCTLSECPLCHLKVPLCNKNCPCNIFTSDMEVSPPWEEDKEEEDGIEENSGYCGAPQCNIICGEHEFCANTGQAELCASVKCIQFNV